jgi:hypothetical protein
MKRLWESVKPVRCESHVVHHPICPCELRPEGIPGVLVINGLTYEVEVVGELPSEGEPVIDGYRLTKADGTCHDVCLVAGRWECTCGDWIFRRSVLAEPSRSDCKHTAACRRHFTEPRDSYTASLSPEDRFAPADVEFQTI